MLRLYREVTTVLCEIKLEENCDVIEEVTGTSSRHGITTREVIAEVMVQTALNSTVGAAYLD